jgi:hypothetical protein
MMKYKSSTEVRRSIMFGLVDFGWFFYDELHVNPFRELSLFARLFV